MITDLEKIAPSRISQLPATLLRTENVPFQNGQTKHIVESQREMAFKRSPSLRIFHLRAEGFSQEKIGAELKISQPTISRRLKLGYDKVVQFEMEKESKLRKRREAEVHLEQERNKQKERLTRNALLLIEAIMEQKRNRQGSQDEQSNFQLANYPMFSAPQLTVMRMKKPRDRYTGSSYVFYKRQLEERRMEIVRRRIEGEKYESISRELGVSIHLVSRKLIKSGLRNRKRRWGVMPKEVHNRIQKLSAQGRSAKAIANKLNVSISAVRTHLRNLRSQASKNNAHAILV